MQGPDHDLCTVAARCLVMPIVCPADFHCSTPCVQGFWRELALQEFQWQREPDQEHAAWNFDMRKVRMFSAEGLAYVDCPAWVGGGNWGGIGVPRPFLRCTSTTAVLRLRARCSLSGSGAAGPTWPTTAWTGKPSRCWAGSCLPSGAGPTQAVLAPRLQAWGQHCLCPLPASFLGGAGGIPFYCANPTATRDP